MNFITRLDDYLDSVRTLPFEWGKHDCLSFTNEAWEQMYGEGYADDWLGSYHVQDSLVAIRKLRDRFKFDTLPEAISSKLQQKNQPVIGDLVMTEKSLRGIAYIGGALGICTGNKSAFLSDKGLEFVFTDCAKYSWGPN